MKPIKVLAIAWTNLVGGVLFNEELDPLLITEHFPEEWSKRKVTNESVRA